MVALPNIELSYGTDMTEDPKVRRVEFGEGYSQRSNPYLNKNRQKWRLQYNGVTDADAETLRTFFEGLAGTGIIDWTPHNQLTALKFTAGQFRSKPIGYNANDCSVEITQEFDV